LNPPKGPTTGGSSAELSQRAVELRKAWQEQRAALEADFEQLEKQLAQKSAVFHQQHERRTVRPAAVIASLKQAPRATALVDILEYEHFADLGTKNSGEQRVAAFVIESDGQIHRVELGPARPIHDAILAWRESYGGARLNQNPGQVLRQLLWTPLEGYLKQADTVLISPDGPLAQLPWAALPGRNPSTYLIEERAIAVVPIPQILPELLREAPHDEAPDSLLVAGDIAYGGDAGSSSDLLAQRSAVGRERGGNWLQFSELPNAASELKSILGGYEQVKQRAHVDVLERQDATEEAFREQAPIHAWVHLVTHGFFAPAELNARLATSAPAAPAAPAQANLGQAIAGVGAVFVMRNGHCLVDRLFTDGAADKDGRLQAGDELIAVAQAGGQWVDVQDKELQQVLSMTRGPAGAAVRLRVRPQANPDRVIELELVRAVLPTSAAAQRPPPTNPGLLSGLAFAGSNKPPENGHDDGILTAMEVASLDLSQVDTVVLSACETGLGEVAGGEGLLGLQRAFEVAGAKTVVASLWKVPDRATQMLMTRFYQNLWQKKMPKLDALREAQLWMLRDVPKDQELLAQANRGVDIDAPAEKPDSSSLSPRYWAAFVLSGDWR
ncbi:MAG TPA: CHAT domain-containing protein, partial [Pirellulales bacterium]|nr:CHAT domain-containing protein [Pirellulales bacterium]